MKPFSIFRRAFTLIELLIVVAIIAILAAIAVPNLLEAQVRAKVTRAKADLRTIATALESYGVDNNEYPDILTPPMVLTTPIAYMSSFIQDPFRTQLTAPVSGPFSIFFKVYSYGSQPLDSASRYILESLGPDLDIDTYLGPSNGLVPDLSALRLYPGWSQALFSPAAPQGMPPDAVSPSSFALYIIYDPTNGTVSSGDIFRYSDHQNI